MVQSSVSLLLKRSQLIGRYLTTSAQHLLYFASLSGREYPDFVVFWEPRSQPGEQGLKGSELVGTKTAAGKGGIAYEFS